MKLIEKILRIKMYKMRGVRRLNFDVYPYKGLRFQKDKCCKLGKIILFMYIYPDEQKDNFIELFYHQYCIDDNYRNECKGKYVFFVNKVFRGVFTQEEIDNFNSFQFKNVSPLLKEKYLIS